MKPSCGPFHKVPKAPAKAKAAPMASTPRVTAVELDHHRLGALAAAEAIVRAVDEAARAGVIAPTTTTTADRTRSRGPRS